jgi:hypothetical protein
MVQTVKKYFIKSQSKGKTLLDTCSRRRLGFTGMATHPPAPPPPSAPLPAPPPAAVINV